KLTSSTNAWAVGGYGGLSSDKSLILHYDGTNWTRQTSPSPSGGLNALEAVAATSTSNAWAVGTQGTGTLGGCQGNQERPYLRPALFAHPDAQLDTLIEHYNGTRWSVQAGVNPGACDNVLEGAAATSSSDGWAAGYSNDTCSQSNDKTLVEHYNGTAWVKLNTPNPGDTGNDLYSISAD